MAYGDVSGGTGFPRVIILLDPGRGEPFIEAATLDLALLLPTPEESVLYDTRRPEFREVPTPLGSVEIGVDDRLISVGEDRGFQLDLELEWPAVNDTGRGVLATIISHKAVAGGGLYKVYPHYGDMGDPDRWYICRLVDASGIGDYLKGPGGGDLYLGWGPVRLVFRVVEPVPYVYHEPTPFYFTDADEAGYDPDEICHFSAVGTTYGVNDKIAMFNSDGRVYEAEPFPGADPRQIAQA